MVDVELYGGRRGYLAHLQARALHALGVYSRLGEINWASVGQLVFICKGNICRSPYASARAQLLGVPTASFGLEAAEGTPPDPAAAHNARLRGVDLSVHRSARLDKSRIREDDLLIVFEPQQLNAVRQRCDARTVSVTLLGLCVRPPRPHIHDPYGRSDRYFQQCFGIIDAGVSELARRWLQTSRQTADSAVSRPMVY